MISLVLLLSCLFVGVFLARLRGVPSNAHEKLGKLILWVSLPALIFHVIPALKLPETPAGSLPSWIALPGVAWIWFGGAILFVRALSRHMNWDRNIQGGLILTAGLGNTSFVGLPLIEALLGKSAIAPALLLDQLGSFLIVSTWGIYVAVAYSGSGRVGFRDFAKRVLRFPPFVALMLAFAWGALMHDTAGPLENLSHAATRAYSTLDPIFNALGKTLSPLALITVGLQLKFNRAELMQIRKPLALGLTYKLVLTPFMIWALSAPLGLTGLWRDVAILEAAMATMITGSIVAQQYGLAPRLSALMVGLGVPVSLVTVPIWRWLISF